MEEDFEHESKERGVIDNKEKLFEQNILKALNLDLNVSQFLSFCSLLKERR